MIDFHSHILPKVDDGSKSVEESIEMLNKLKSEILCVRGNCDTEVDQMVLDFPILAEYALLPIGNNTIFITGGMG